MCFLKTVNELKVTVLVCHTDAGRGRFAQHWCLLFVCLWPWLGGKLHAPARSQHGQHTFFTYWKYFIYLFIFFRMLILCAGVKMKHDNSTKDTQQRFRLRVGKTNGCVILPWLDWQASVPSDRQPLKTTASSRKETSNICTARVPYCCH